MIRKILGGLGAAAGLVAAAALGTGAALVAGAPAQASTCGGTVACFYYAGGSVTTTAKTGFTVAADVEKPVVTTANGDVHSLFEILVKNPSTGDTVEWGWTVDPGAYGNGDPHLFEGAWAGSTFLGYNTGLGSDAFCNLTPTVRPGSSIAQASYPALKQFSIDRSATAWPYGSWYFNYGGSYVGCLPDSFLAAHGVADLGSAKQFQSFGEVASYRSLAAGSAPCAQMGSGTKGSLTNTVSPAAARSANAVFADGTFPVMVQFTSASDGSNAGAYYNTGNLGVSGRSFYYGGDNTAC